MFESLSDKLGGVFGKLTARGRLSEKDVDAALREVRLALLEADVDFKVTRDFVKTIKERAGGEEVFSSLTPGQTVVKIVQDSTSQVVDGAGHFVHREDQQLVVDTIIDVVRKARLW